MLVRLIYAKLPTKASCHSESPQEAKRVHVTECGICADTSRLSGYVTPILTLLTTEGCVLNVGCQGGFGTSDELSPHSYRR